MAPPAPGDPTVPARSAASPARYSTRIATHKPQQIPVPQSKLSIQKHFLDAAGMAMPPVYITPVDTSQYDLQLVMSRQHGANLMSIHRLAEKNPGQTHIAINGGFFDTAHAKDPVRFLACGDVYQGPTKQTEPAVLVMKDGKVRIEILDKSDKDPAVFYKRYGDVRFAVAGMCLIVKDGVLGNFSSYEIPPTSLTCVGTDRSGKAYLIVAEHTTYQRLAEFLISQGMFRVVRLDGGSSSNIVYRKGSQYRSPSPRLNRDNRNISNAIVVTSRPLRTAPTAATPSLPSAPSVWSSLNIPIARGLLYILNNVK